MKSKMKKKGVASIPELRDLCIEAEVKMVACQMTVDLFDFEHDDLIDDVEYGGAATFFEFAGEADITLYVSYDNYELSYLFPKLLSRNAIFSI